MLPRDSQLRKNDFEEVDKRHLETFGLEDAFNEPMMYWDIDYMRYVDGEPVENDDILELAGIKKEWLDPNKSWALRKESHTPHSPTSLSTYISS